MSISQSINTFSQFLYLNTPQHVHPFIQEFERNALQQPDQSISLIQNLVQRLFPHLAEQAQRIYTEAEQTIQYIISQSASEIRDIVLPITQSEDLRKLLRKFGIEIQNIKEQETLSYYTSIIMLVSQLLNHPVVQAPEILKQFGPEFVVSDTLILQGFLQRSQEYLQESQIPHHTKQKIHKIKTRTPFQTKTFFWTRQKHHRTELFNQHRGLY